MSSILKTSALYSASFVCISEEICIIDIYGAKFKLNINVSGRYKCDEDRLPLTSSMKQPCFLVLTSGEAAVISGSSEPVRF